MMQDMRYLEETAETGKGKNQGSLAWSKYRKMEGGRDERDQSRVNLRLIHVLAWPFLLLCLICPPASSALETQLGSPAVTGGRVDPSLCASETSAHGL